MKEKLRVWWIPQVGGCPAFHVYVDNIVEAVKIMEILASYDAFQYDNHIKPDYSNAGGVELFEAGEWCDWYIEDEELGYFDDPEEYLTEKEKSWV